MRIRRVGILTAGGIAPCLSAAVGSLILGYAERDPAVEILCYRHGYAGLLLGDSIVVTGEVRSGAERLLHFGGSAIGNSRVRLENREDCIRRGLVRPGQDPQIVATERIVADGIDVLHTIGGDDTSAVAAELAKVLEKNGHGLAVVGLPKTIDNDIQPIVKTLGADTAADESAKFFTHIANECTTSPRMLIVHEIMGRNCGWLTAEAALRYRSWLGRQQLLPSIGLARERWDLHGVYLPELAWDLANEGRRLANVMDAVGNVNIFVAEGAGAKNVLEEMEKDGIKIPRDAFGHAQLDRINLGQWLGERLAKVVGAAKVLVQKSGYFARSAAPNAEDSRLIRETVHLAIDSAFRGLSGVVGCSQEMNGQLSLIPFDRIRGGRKFDPTIGPFAELLRSIGQLS
ncbi:MAG: pyrophosphate--fructose-6-phosphate 1-phosphotransferase [Puniceicoccales bacterium]|nr:pyrophosphate--fructose-6-phosphate 1-phosphotransferase [Puniceicoccales bacterium]